MAALPPTWRLLGHTLLTALLGALAAGLADGLVAGGPAPLATALTAAGLALWLAPALWIGLLLLAGLDRLGAFGPWRAHPARAGAAWIAAAAVLAAALLVGDAVGALAGPHRERGGAPRPAGAGRRGGRGPGRGRPRAAPGPARQGQASTACPRGRR
ncbi:MAG: hypothetical protein H6706_22670 [Myxococcales bacterium]|nr:hypothetical protein [Myxococcales bacterium]